MRRRVYRNDMIKRADNTVAEPQAARHQQTKPQWSGHPSRAAPHRAAQRSRANAARARPCCPKMSKHSLEPCPRRAHALLISNMEVGSSCASRISCVFTSFARIASFSRSLSRGLRRGVECESAPFVAHAHISYSMCIMHPCARHSDFRSKRALSPRVIRSSHLRMLRRGSQMERAIWRMRPQHRVL